MLGRIDRTASIILGNGPARWGTYTTKKGLKLAPPPSVKKTMAPSYGLSQPLPDNYLAYVLGCPNYFDVESVAKALKEMFVAKSFRVMPRLARNLDLDGRKLPEGMKAIAVLAAKDGSELPLRVGVSIAYKYKFGARHDIHFLPNGGKSIKTVLKPFMKDIIKNLNLKVNKLA